MSTSLPWKIGLEFELLAPEGSSRKTLAEEIAKANKGRVHRIFYPQSEFAPLENVTIFENLTLGYTVENQAGDEVVKCVDDLTIIDDLDATYPPEDGWYRILSDDQRFLSLVELHCDPMSDHLSVLEPLANLFDVKLELVNDEPLTRVMDKRGASIAMAACLPGERHRPCELITAPMTSDRDPLVRHYLEIASKLSFTVPKEAAIHIHFDGTPLKSPTVMSELIRIFGHYRSDLRQLVGTNPNCRRLGDWPKEIYRLVTKAGFSTLDWSEAANQIRSAEPEKFCDFNIVNLLTEESNKDTFEVRIVPGSMDADFILANIRLFEALLNHCVTKPDPAKSSLPNLMDFITEIGLKSEDIEYWCTAWESNNKASKFNILKALGR